MGLRCVYLAFDSVRPKSRIRSLFCLHNRFHLCVFTQEQENAFTIFGWTCFGVPVHCSCTKHFDILCLRCAGKFQHIHIKNARLLRSKLRCHNCAVHNFVAQRPILLAFLLLSQIRFTISAQTIRIWTARARS